jgi:hypothetical protein
MSPKPPTATKSSLASQLELLKSRRQGITTPEQAKALETELRSLIERTRKEIPTNYKDIKTLEKERGYLLEKFSGLPEKKVDRHPLESFRFSNPELLKTDESKKGQNIHLDQDTPEDLEQFFQNTTPEILNPNTDPNFLAYCKEKNITEVKRYHVCEYLSTLTEHYYIPGLDYWEYIQKHADQFPQLKDGNWYYTASSLFRRSGGRVVCPSSAGVVPSSLRAALG